MVPDKVDHLLCQISKNEIRHIIDLAGFVIKRNDKMQGEALDLIQY
jgi:hypothetical protein